MRRLAILGLILLVPRAAWAHASDPAGALPLAWSFEPWVIGPMAMAALLYGFGWRRLRRRSGLGREALDGRAGRFALGWLVLAAAVVSPLHQAGGRSFTAHMLEHELMMLAAAPLLVAGRPLAMMLWAFPSAVRRALGGAGRSRIVAGPFAQLTHPIAATLIQAAALWLWHAPSLFDRALASEGWHVAQHVSFLMAALLFWSAMFDRRRTPGLAALCLFATSVVTGALGALMAISQSPWYAPYAALGMTPFGLTPAEDQQLAGVLMWVPGGMVHAVIALVLLAPSLVSALIDKEDDRGVSAG